MKREKAVIKGFELLELHERWVKAVSEHFDLARKAWRETERGGDSELKYMRDLLTNFDLLTGKQP